MFNGLATLLLSGIVSFGNFIEENTLTECPEPVVYRIGMVAPEFNVTQAELRQTLAQAEAFWDNSSGLNLFEYGEEGKLTLNFIYDERQAYQAASSPKLQLLKQSQAKLDPLVAERSELESAYGELAASFEADKEVYAEKLATYTNEVRYWNQKGGTTPAAYAELAEQRTWLEGEQKRLQTEKELINSLATEFNDFNDNLNASLIEHNALAAEFNEPFAGREQFVAADAGKYGFNIYQFDSLEELETLITPLMSRYVGAEINNGLSFIKFIDPACREKIGT